MKLLTALLLLQLSVAELTAYVEDFLAVVNKMRGFEKRRADALALIPIVVQWSRAYQVDPLLVAVIISFESSWRTNVPGLRHEIGPMQIMPETFKRLLKHMQYPKSKWKKLMADTDTQIHVGIGHLMLSLSACGGDLARGINHYGSGRCEPVGKWVQWRLRAYEQAKRRYRR